VPGDMLETVEGPLQFIDPHVFSETAGRWRFT
jgi:hypothetical protein